MGGVAAAFVATMTVSLLLTEFPDEISVYMGYFVSTFILSDITG
jgi:hypothetical protein